MCFIAIESDNEVMSLDNKSDLFYNELHDSFETLYNKYKKLAFKYSLLKKNYAYLESVCLRCCFCV
ncbi:hypothetical protein NC652_001722 [Populus alba x Populus x berolinensis]|nr:hypothetical protein NC652_001722 [Populus alba x Populus x berolinensis]